MTVNENTMGHLQHAAATFQKAGVELSRLLRQPPAHVSHGALIGAVRMGKEEADNALAVLYLIRDDVYFMDEFKHTFSFLVDFRRAGSVVTANELHEAATTMLLIGANLRIIANKLKDNGAVPKPEKAQKVSRWEGTIPNYTVADAKNRLAALGIDAAVTARGSNTFFIVVDLGTDNHRAAYDRSTIIFRKLQQAGLTTQAGGQTGDHGRGHQDMEAIISLNPPEPPNKTTMPLKGGTTADIRGGLENIASMLRQTSTAAQKRQQPVDEADLQDYLRIMKGYLTEVGNFVDQNQRPDVFYLMSGRTLTEVVNSLRRAIMTGQQYRQTPTRQIWSRHFGNIGDAIHLTEMVARSLKKNQEQRRPGVPYGGML